MAAAQNGVKIAESGQVCRREFQAKMGGGNGRKNNVSQQQEKVKNSAKLRGTAGDSPEKDNLWCSTQGEGRFSSKLYDQP